ncbi:zinc-binding protein A33-like [Girardinichthys multiradiatus]|uniref:zinc-binding protein A33-like n=1 Tax=Girardinichthys multiradiatus TaxID=208333 RepID=UPI001FAC7066|nr:zinc-binding protein A33-like [Girardinichthys multiradiatus]
MAFRPEEDLTCCICHDIFKDPVALSCSHSFCNDCVKSWWWDKQQCECPVCKTVSQTRQPPRNLALRNLCEAIVSRKENDSEGLCRLHSEKFKLFCLDHQEPVCVICRDSKAHNNHRFRPIDEVAQESKKKVQMLLLPLQKKLKLFEEVKEQFEEKDNYIKTQAEHTEAQIKDEFKKLYQFLQKEEKKRISALRYKAKMNKKWLRCDCDDLSRRMALLSETIRVTEEELKAENVTFLQNYKTAVKNIQQCSMLDDAPPCFGYLLNVAEHLGNLASLIWTEIEKTTSCTPVVLNPNTAHQHLTISADLTSLRYSRRRKVPKIPERIDYYRCVLGSEGFDSGSHIWDVEVGDGGHWGLGVAAWLAYKKKDIKSGLWIIKFERNEYSAVSQQNEVRLHQVKKFRKIRIHLRCDRRKLSFFDPETGAHIHSFTQIFQGRLFPYFSNGGRSPLKILPTKGSTNLPPLIIIGFIVMMMTLFLFLRLI